MNTRINILMLLLAWQCCGGQAMAQQLNFDLYNKSNGLLNNEVHCILQASNGFMYFGTPAGLSVYDGTLFNNYGIGKGFSSSTISGISELNSRQFILLTNSSKDYQIVDQRLVPDSFADHISVKELYHGRSGRWYASTYSGLYAFRNGELIKLPVREGRSFYGINSVMEWQDSLLIIGRSYEQLDIYNARTWKLVASSSEKLFIRNIFPDTEGNIWISTIGSGVLLLKPRSLRGGHMEFERLPPSFDPFLHSEFRAIVEDKENNLWMAGVNNGLIKYNHLTGAFFHITTDQGLASNSVFCLCCDKEDNIWIGTNSGLQKLVHKNFLFYSSKQGLPADLVLDLLPLPGNRVVTCGYSGCGFLKDFGEKIKAWYPPLEDEYFLKLTSMKGEHFGLSLKKLISFDITHSDVSVKKIYPLSMHFRSMIPFGDDKLLLGGDSCILLFRGGKLSKLVTENVHLISTMAWDPSDILWTGSLNNDIIGYSLNERSNRFSSNVAVRYKARSIGAEDFVQCITVDHRKRILYGMSQSGIFILGRDHNKLKKVMAINTSSGLSNNHIGSLVWFDDTTLLVGTSYGLDKIIFVENKDSFYIQNISDFYDFSTAIYSIKKDERGNILLGAESGLIKIPSIDIEQQSPGKLPIVISSVQLLSGGDSLLNPEKTIELPYDNNGLNIYYSSPSFTNERDIRYIYQLTGGNQNQWSQPSFSNRVTLLNLSPGHYRFKVMPVNLFGHASTEPAAVEIIIRPPFWKRWWFELLLLASAATLVLLIARRRIRTIRREAALKNKIAETEMMALRAQMNPHFIFNCMNIIDGLITNDRKEEALDFLQKFSKLIRLVLENSQYQVVPLHQDLQALRLYIEMEVVRSNYQFNYEFDIDEELEEENYKIPPLLLQPYVENAIIHGLRNKESGEGRLSVSIKGGPGTIIITIEDNGVGREKAIRLNNSNFNPHQPLGMKVTAKRIDLIKMNNQKGVSITVADMNLAGETGTRVTIILPSNLKI